MKLPPSMKKLSYLVCGCSSQENVFGPILAELERLERKEYKEEDDLASAVVDHFGLSEHGTSIRGAFLTPAGVEALAFLRQHGLDWKNAGSFVDDEGEEHGIL